MIYNQQHQCPVALLADKCKGCVHCMRKCPTEAIRVRDGKAAVIEDRCVGCGECVRSCPTRAKTAISDPWSVIEQYKYKVALPEPSAFGQFPNLYNTDILLQGLIDIGFDDVEEIAVAAELVSEATRDYIANKEFEGPVISSACPAIVELIQISYGHLVERISPVAMPEEVAAGRALQRALAKGLKREEIGIFIIGACPAKWAALRNSEDVDGVLAFSEVYFKLVGAMNKVVQPPVRSKTGKLGLSWATSGGEADGVKSEKYLAADGVDNCVTVIQEIDHDKLTSLDFVELRACPGGCVGGVLNIENPFLATTRLRFLKRTRPMTEPSGENVSGYIGKESPLSNNVFCLSTDRAEAMQLMKQIEQIHEVLPGIDCGSCGAPSCRAMAEDIVLYGKSMGRCPFLNGKEKQK